MKTMRICFLLGISTSMALAQVDSRDVDSKDITQELDSQERNLNERESSAKQKFALEAGVEIYNKFGLNGRGASPTDSYGYVLGQINGIYSYKGLEIKLGGAGAGLTYDSTRYGYGAGGFASTSGGFVNEAYNYIGYWTGYDAKSPSSSNNTHNYFIHNANISYKGEHFSIIGGRFYENDENYYNAYAEGIKLKANSQNLYAQISGISSGALVGDGFFWDYTRAYTPNGLLSANFGYKNDHFDLSAFYYYGISEYSAPGINASATFGNPSKIASNTRLNVIFPIYDSFTQIGVLLTPLADKKPDFTSSILIREDIDFLDHYGVSLALYKNIGFANARIGLFGSPLGVNIWDNSVQVLGASLNAIAAPDALTTMIFTRAHYENLAPFVTALEFNLDGRYTTAPSSDEYSLKFSTIWSVTQKIDVLFIANYYTSVVKNIAWSRVSDSAFSGTTTIDRSYLMTKINFKI
ncbi:outer membrane family protein [uncultured Helicobacter sp.]|uniref:outer membrane family protein n=1 Tax=uncultured Helicobacter sp. TaxID=175537 RepID=UPI00259A451D|nr:outer membrane family protein [uncultured Helicobacter sp.]